MKYLYEKLHEWINGSEQPNDDDCCAAGSFVEWCEPLNDKLHKPRYATGPIMHFPYCDKLLGSGDYTDYFGRTIVLGPRSQIRCKFPLGHCGPCANVEYRKIEYPSDET